MNIKFLILLFFILSTINECYSQARYVSKYNTLAHQLIKLEEDASSISPRLKGPHFDSMFYILDKVIDQTIKEIQPLLPITKENENINSVRVLELIDETLIRNSFIICTTVETFEEALLPKNLKDLKCNKYRPKVDSSDNNKYYGIDCDLSAIIYFSIGQVLKLPIHFIEVQNHNFVRWNFISTKYFNWDTNAAGVYSDDNYRQGRSPTSDEGFDNRDEKKSHYLISQNVDEITGYYTGLIADKLSKEKRYLDAEQYLKKAIELRPYSSKDMNNLSWMYVTTPQFNGKNYYQSAYNLSEKVNNLKPNDIDYRDTYSCACAAIGKFDQAIKVERSALNKPYRIKAFQERKTCLDIGEN